MSHRKLQLLKWIDRSGAARANLLYALDGGCRQNVKVALTELKRAGFIYRSTKDEDSLFADHGVYYIYSLTQKGKQLLKDDGHEPYEWKAEQQRWHRVMLSDIVGSLEIIARTKELPFKTRTDILGSSDSFVLEAGTITHPNGDTYSHPVYPDELVAIGDTYFLIEADRATESIWRSNFKTSSYFRKLLQYQNVFRTFSYQKLGLPHLFVLHISTSPEHTSNILKLAEDIGMKSRGNLFKGLSILAHRTRTVRPLLDLLDHPWDRAGYPPHIFEL
jgi:hypothetical protein